MTFVLTAAGCGGAERSPVADAGSEVALGAIGRPLAVADGDLVHVAYRRDETRIVRRDLRTGTPATLWHASADTDVVALAARGRRVFAGTTTLGEDVIHRVVEVTRPGRPRTLSSSRDRTTCGRATSLEGITRGGDAVIADVTVSCRQAATGRLRLRTGAGRLQLLRRELPLDRASWLLHTPSLSAGAGAGRVFFADHTAGEITDRGATPLALTGPIAPEPGINARGDLLVDLFDTTARTQHTWLYPGGTSARRLVARTSTAALRPSDYTLCGDAVVRYTETATRGTLAVADRSAPTAFRTLRRVRIDERRRRLVCDASTVVLVHSTFHGDRAHATSIPLR